MCLHKGLSGPTLLQYNVSRTRLNDILILPKMQNIDDNRWWLIELMYLTKLYFKANIVLSSKLFCTVSGVKPLFFNLLIIARQKTHILVYLFCLKISACGNKILSICPYSITPTQNHRNWKMQIDSLNLSTRVKVTNKISNKTNSFQSPNPNVEMFLIHRS